MTHRPDTVLDDITDMPLMGSPHVFVMGTVDCVWNVMAHAQKPDFVIRRNGPSPFKSAGGRQFSVLLAAEVCTSAVVMLDTPCFEVVWRVVATHCIRQFSLHLPSRTSPCAIIFQLDSTLQPTELIFRCELGKLGNTPRCAWLV